MTTEQIITIGIVIALLAAVINQGVSLYRKDTQHASLIQIVAETAQRIGDNPVWLENAKAAGAGVPQEAFNGVIGRLDAIEAFVGQQSALGNLAQRIEDVIKKVDHDTSNDPSGQPAADAAPALS